MARRKFKKPPPFLFRYRPPDEVRLGYLEGLLSEDRIWASPPRGFEDSNDCRAQIDFNLTQEEVFRYWTWIFKKLGQRGKAARKEAHKIVADGGWKDPRKHAEIGQNFQGTLDNSGVICVTVTALDTRMWNDYAGGSRGVCLCFETSEWPFSEMFDVNYVPELPTVKINADSGDQIDAFLLTKGTTYSWEREWRFVDYDKGGGYKTISPWALQAIVLGRQIEAAVKQEVMRLVACLKPHVSLFAVDDTGADLRLQLLDGPQHSMGTGIIPPIQERRSRKPPGRRQSAHLLDYLDSVVPEHRRPDLDLRIRSLAANLKAVESSQGRPSKEAVAGAVAAVREAPDLLREIVDRSGAAMPGYGEVAVLLYGLVHEMVLKKGSGAL